MTLGSAEFFLNAFSGIAQHGGGFEQANPNWENRVAQYIVSSADGVGDRGDEITLSWLKAFGIQAIAVGGPGSKEAFHPFHHLNRFSKIGTLAWQHGDDFIFKIPLRNASLAHALYSADLVKTPPINGIDTEQMTNYVRAIDNPEFPEVSFRWTSQHSAELNGHLVEGEVIATQISYFPGWKATAGGVPLRTYKDGLGFLVIEPKCSGDCRVHLVYDGGPEMRIGILLCLIATLGSFIWISHGRLLSFLHGRKLVQGLKYSRF